MRYVDGYVLPVSRKNLRAYAAMARKGGKVWRELGALSYTECAGEDLATKFGLPFPKALKIKRGETVVFSFIVFKSRAHRDRVNAKVMKDPRLQAMMTMKSMPFDPNRMLYGGFEVLVDA